MAEIPRKYCFCASNLRAAKFIALVSIFLRALAIASYVYGLIFFTHTQTVQIFMGLTIGIYGIYIIFDILLHIGVTRMSKPLLLIWLVFAGIMIGLCLASMVFQMWSINGFILAIFAVILQIWAMLVVVAAIQEINVFHGIGMTKENKV